MKGQRGKGLEGDPVSIGLDREEAEVFLTALKSH